MRNLYPFLFCLLLASTSHGQQDPQFSHNYFNRFQPNVGAAGRNPGNICGTMILRNQWTGFEGAPQTGLLSVHGPVEKLHGGLGLSVMADRLGQERSLYVKGAYAFRVDLGVGTLGVGLGLGLINKTLLSDWRPPDQLPSQDPTLNNNDISTYDLDLDLGIYYETPKLYFGLSSTHLPQPRAQKDGGEGSTAFSVDYGVARHYYVMAGYKHQFAELPSWEFQPSTFIKSDGVTSQVSVNVNALYQERFWGGVGYRFQDAVIASIGVVQPNIGPGTMKAGYAYDVTTSSLRQHSSGSHEIFVGYCWPIPIKPPPSHGNVRFLYHGKGRMYQSDYKSTTDESKKK